MHESGTIRVEVPMGRLVLALLLALTCGCGYTTKPPDADGDADADADADGDGDADADGDADCAAAPTARGCPCDDGQPVVCYSGPEGTAGVGACVVGLLRCDDGVSTGCVGEVTPADESCDFVDEDCDGVVDDGVQSACGDCNADCAVDCVGAGCAEAFDSDDGAGVLLDENGALTVGEGIGPQQYVIWISNSTEGTVSRIDTRTREEVGRYRTGPVGYPDPSRTSANLRGDVAVSNRSHGSTTMIRASECVDMDGDGAIRTSSGADDVLDWGQDDCVVWNVDGIPAARGTAFEIRPGLDGAQAEVVWVVSYPFQNGPLVEIDAESGERTGREVADMPGYGAAMGPDGILWLTGLGSPCAMAVDTTTLETTEYACPAGEYSYGITVAADGRVWVGGSVARLDPVTEQWDSPDPEISGGGIAVDLAGNAWVGELGGGAHRIDGETLEAEPILGAGGHGWAIDFDGYVWSVDMVDSAHVVDPEDLSVEDVTPPFEGPYTYSDMTGFQLQSISGAAGTYRHVFYAECPGEATVWSSLEWDGVIPSRAGISFRVRVAGTLDDLDAEEWLPLAAPEGDGDLGAILGADRTTDFLEVEVTLTTAVGAARPTLERLSVTHECMFIAK